MWVRDSVQGAYAWDVLYTRLAGAAQLCRPSVRWVGSGHQRLTQAWGLPRGWGQAACWVWLVDRCWAHLALVVRWLAVTAEW